MSLEDWTPEVQRESETTARRRLLDVSEILDRLQPQCPAPALLGHRDPCRCLPETEFRDVHVWGRP